MGQGEAGKVQAAADKHRMVHNLIDSLATKTPKHEEETRMMPSHVSLSVFVTWWPINNSLE